MADVVTGYGDGGSFWFMAARADNLTCRTLMDNAAQRPGARTVGDVTYAPAALEAPAVETSDGVGMFCMTLPGGSAAVISLQPSRLTVSQQLSIRRLAEAIRSSVDAVGSALPAGAAELGMTQPLWLAQMGLTVPVIPGNGWTAGTYYAPSGSPLDKITGTGSGGTQMSVTLTHLVPDGSTTCATAIGHFLTGNARLVENSDYIPSRWYPSTVATDNGVLVCLPLGQGILAASIGRLDSDVDRTAVRALLIGVRYAAVARWGEP